jgi:ketopantoate reductase
MNTSFAIEELARNQTVFSVLLNGISPDEYLWRFQKDKWNLLEIVCHLYDEEREDFRARIKSVFKDPSKKLEPFYPETWVKDRKYAEQAYFLTLNNFLMERHDSIEWLESLQQPKWKNAYIHPKMGPVSASFLLNNWLAHDYLHIRQIIKLRYLYTQHISGESLDYAGKW